MLILQSECYDAQFKNDELGGANVKHGRISYRVLVEESEGRLGRLRRREDNIKMYI